VAVVVVVLRGPPFCKIGLGVIVKLRRLSIVISMSSMGGLGIKIGNSSSSSSSASTSNSSSIGSKYLIRRVHRGVGGGEGGQTGEGETKIVQKWGRARGWGVGGA